MASIHRKSKGGTWYISYRQEGKLKHRSLGTKNERKARELKREVEVMLEQTGTAELVVTDKPREAFRNPPVDHFWESFRGWALAHRSRATLVEYGNWFGQFKDFSGIALLGDATKVHAEAFKAKLLRQGKQKPVGVGLDKVSINNALKTLKSIWSHASKLGLYSGGNPFAEVETFHLPQRRDRTYLEKEQIDALMVASEQYAHEKYVKQAEAANVRIAIALMALAGLRKKEVCFALWEWVNWDRKTLVVSSHKEFTTKNKRSRSISIHEDLLGILEPYRNNAGYILTELRSSSRKSLYRADFKRSFARVCKLAGVEATPHDLRHSFASRHVVRGRSLHVIAGWLGHSTTWITEHYAHFQQTYNSDVNDM